MHLLCSIFKHQKVVKKGNPVIFRDLWPVLAVGIQGVKMKFLIERTSIFLVLSRDTKLTLFQKEIFHLTQS